MPVNTRLKAAIALRLAIASPSFVEKRKEIIGSIEQTINMTKSISLVAVSSMAFIAFMVAMTMSASAASITNVEYSNGDVTIQGTAGQSVSGKVRVVVPVNEEVEFVQFDVISDSLAPHCESVGRLQEGTHFVNITGVKFPPNTGSYALEVKTAGIFGGLAAIDCVSNVTGTQSFGASVRTVGSATSVSGGSMFDTMQNQITTLMAQIACMAAGSTWEANQCKAKPAPVTPTKCAALASKLMGTVDNAYNQANVMLQGYLLSEGASIPALQAGASFGYKGSQTNAAISMFKASNQCTN